MLIVMCIVGMWLFQILENIGMTCGLMPITGIPLPFVSYGSSFMVVNFMHARAHRVGVVPQQRERKEGRLCNSPLT